MTSSSSDGLLGITVAGYEFDRVVGLSSGRVPVDGCDVRFETASIGDMNTHIFSGPGTREVSEVGLSPFLLAYANDDFRAYTLIPVFPLRLFRHKSIFIRKDSGISGPEDLRDRKVGTAGYSTTSLTWIRGILQHEYGVKPDEIRWVLSDEDSSAHLAGQRSDQELAIPDNIEVTYGMAGKDESDMLVDGDVDALFHAAEPRAFVEGNPQIARLFPDSRITERSYFAKTGIFPIMHAVAIRSDVAEANPWLPEAVFHAYSAAKQQAYRELRTTAWVMNSLPWLTQEAEATRDLMGENFWPYGIESNQTTLSAILQYSDEQGLTRRRLSVEEVFHPSTWKLTETV